MIVARHGSGSTIHVQSPSRATHTAGGIERHTSASVSKSAQAQSEPSGGQFSNSISTSSQLRYETPWWDFKAVFPPRIRMDKRKPTTFAKSAVKTESFIFIIGLINNYLQ